ncbi:hypothetical protein NDU88_003834 [Pleurodeles waltl]|uniref:Uncharacterized protein n=1 Tax=Pleurodeles waltl TaxID=8319 RepID=A0AAV7RE93_PLEWA|nr:hypothetical protein NDU88_003834 [Pleurodeles waltl]
MPVVAPKLRSGRLAAHSRQTRSLVSNGPRTARRVLRSAFKPRASIVSGGCCTDVQELQAPAQLSAFSIGLVVSASFRSAPPFTETHSAESVPTKNTMGGGRGGREDAYLEVLLVRAPSFTEAVAGPHEHKAVDTRCFHTARTPASSVRLLSTAL